MTKPGFVDIYPASRIPRSIQHNFKAVSRSRHMGIEEQSSPMNTTRQKGLRILADSGTLSSALRWVSDEEVCSFCSTHQHLELSYIQYLHDMNLHIPNIVLISF
jgi:intermediate peptidase